nr:hypothetical protein [Tanacetum cinerariifolium]
MEKEPEATKDTDLPSTKNIQPPSVQVHEKDKEAIDTPFIVPKTKTNLPYLSRLLSINLNSQRLDKEKQEVKNIIEQPTQRRTRIEKSLQNFRVIHKSSISLKNTSQISSVHAITSILSTKVPEYSFSMGYEHPNTTLETESDEIIKSGVEELVPIPSENEVTSEDKRECDMLICENYPICDDHYEIFFVCKNDNDEQSLTLKCGDTPSISYNNKVDLIDARCEEYSQEVLGFSDVGDILYFENLLKEDPFQLPPIDLKEVEELTEKSFINEPPEFYLKEFSDELAHINPKITKADFDFEEEIRLIENLLYDNSYPRPPKEFNAEIANMNVESFPSSLILVQDNDSQREEIDIVTNTDELLPPGFENDDLEGEIDVLMIPRPPSEPPDADFETDSREEISVVMNDSDEFKCFNPRDEFDVSKDENDGYFPFMFVIQIFLQHLIYSKMFSFLLSAESEDTIFNPGISV